MPAMPRTSEDAAKITNRTVRVDHIGMYSWTAGERARMERSACCERLIARIYP
jgi:hypothetical protein